MADRTGIMRQMRASCITCLRLLLGGKDTPEVSLKDICSLLCIREEVSTVHNHHSQICLLQSENKSITEILNNKHHDPKLGLEICCYALHESTRKQKKDYIR